MCYNGVRRFQLPLSDDEKNAIRESFLVELESEHYQREERANRKMRTASLSVSFQNDKKEEEINSFKSDLRLQFYRSNNYIMGKDHTGRDKWLSPTEQERRKRRKGSKKKQDSFTINFKLKSEHVLLYSGIVVFAIILGIFIAK